MGNLHVMYSSAVVIACNQWTGGGEDTYFLLLLKVLDVLQIAVTILGCCFFLSFLIQQKAVCIKYKFYYLLLYFLEELLFM